MRLRRSRTRTSGRRCHWRNGVASICRSPGSRLKAYSPPLGTPRTIPIRSGYMTDTTETQRERGLAILNDVYRRDLGINGEKDPYQEVTVDHLFGDIWARDGLDYRDRRLMTLGVLAAIGRDELVELQ